MRLNRGRRGRLATRLGVAAALTLALLALNGAAAQDDPKPAKEPAKPAKPPAVKLGLHLNDPKAFQGYTLFSPLMSKTTYLMDMQGKVVRKWEGEGSPALCPYLLENGNLLRPCTITQQVFGGAGPGAGGKVQEFTWDGQLVWDFTLVNEKQLPHHDICRLPNGNVLMVVWDKKTAKEAIAAGRRPEQAGETHLLPDSVLEVKPTGKTTGEVVWEWHVWDHLVQDGDKSKANYGDVAAHPELVDINFGDGLIAALVTKKDGLDKLKSLGYVGGTPPPAAGKKPQRINPDWTHLNAVSYNADFDQIIVSVHAFSEIWVIDHSTTKAEAASHKGGRSGKGGDLLYRWGNPVAYRAGTAKDQKLFNQHNAHWIPKGHLGEGHLLLFNNGGRRPGGSSSSVDELVLPVDAEGRYSLKPGTAYGPDSAVWSYSAPKKSDFYSSFISGAQRLPNGNTLICSGANGTLFEVTPEKEIVWKYINPTKAGPGGPGGPGGPPQLGQIVPSFMQDMLKMSDEQKKQAGEFQKELGGKLEKMLTDDQKKKAKEPMGGAPGAITAGPPRFGEIMPKSLQDRLKLTDEQKKQLEVMQKEADGKLDALLKDEQKKQVKDMQQGFAFGGPPGKPGAVPAKPGGNPGGPGGFGGPPGGASVFRAYRYAASYPGLVGKDLTPGKTVEEMQPKDPKSK